MKTKIRWLQFLGIGLCSIAPAWAYPIPPQTLWPLVEQSDVIVIARVRQVAAQPPSDEPLGNSHEATLDVLESLKGDPEAVIRVPFPGNLICPAPPLFLEKETLLAFLAHGEDGQLATVGLSYGTLYPQGKNALGDFRVMVRSAIAIQQAKLAEPVLARQKQAWLVEAAARPGTRWHGLYGLDPAADQIRVHYDSNAKKAAALLPREQEMLAEAFMAANVADRTLPMLLQVLAGRPDQEVDGAAMAWIEGLLATDEPPWWTGDLIVTLLRRLRDKAPEARLLDDQGETDWDIEPERLRAIWAKAKGELDLPTLPPRTFVPERYLPVGGQTPS